ncbi:MAG: branched-chain amino acid ABC transporter permease [Actinomycetota bacterium]|nr:branched-chain amino acid ABC transporter permease [Actinomycetota bacterium]
MSMSTSGITHRYRSAKAPIQKANDNLRLRWRNLPFPLRVLGYVVLIALAMLLPAQSIGNIMAPQSDWPTILFYPIGSYILLALGLNVVVGLAGMLDLGYVAFFAIGGYTMAVLGVNYNWSFWEILPVGIAAAALSGVILGAPTLRLRGDYLAIVTLGFGEIIQRVVNNLTVTGGPTGISGIPHPPSVGTLSFLTYGVLDPRPYYYLEVVMIALVLFFSIRLENSRVGRGWVALREDEDAAEIMGVPTFTFKIWAFAIGASVGGLSGVVYAAKVIAITPENYPLLLSVLILVCVVLGGSGNRAGVILGAFLVAWLPERFRGLANYRILFFGAMLVIMMIFRPGGLLPARRRASEFAHGIGGGQPLGGEIQSGQFEDDEDEKE